MNKWLKQIRVKAILPAAALIAAAAIGTTFAWQKWDLSVTNQLKSHKTAVEVEEDFNPGNDTKQNVKFTNTGTSSVFVRVSYTEYWEKEEGGKKYVLSNTYKDADGTDVRYAKLWFNEDGNGDKPDDQLWQFYDGWYYYKKPLKKGESTEIFLKKVDFDKNKCSTKFEDDYCKDNYHLYFKVEAVQCSDGSNTLNPDEVNAHATYKMFGYWADTRSEKVIDGKITWHILKEMPTDWQTTMPKDPPTKATDSSNP